MNDMKLANNLLYHCKRKGLSISGLARLSGVKQPTLHGWTTGRSVKNVEDLKKVCAVLEVGLHTMIFGEEDPFESSQARTVNEIFMSDFRIIIEKINEKK